MPCLVQGGKLKSYGEVAEARLGLRGVLTGDLLTTSTRE